VGQSAALPATQLSVIAITKRDVRIAAPKRT